MEIITIRDILREIIKYLRDGDKWVLSQVNKLLSGYRTSYNNEILMYFVKRGYLKLVKLARESGCHWDARACSEATKNGRLDMLKWLRKNGCPREIDTCTYAYTYTYTCTYAVENGHRDAFKWALENGCDWGDMRY